MLIWDVSRSQSENNRLRHQQVRAIATAKEKQGGVPFQEQASIKDSSSGKRSDKITRFLQPDQLRTAQNCSWFGVFSE